MNMIVNKPQKHELTNNLSLIAWLLFFFVFASHAMSQSKITDVVLKSGENGSVVIDFEFDGVVVEPEVFVTQMPARIALDFVGASNQSDTRNLAIGLGNAKGLRMVSTDSKTRAVIDLMSVGDYQISKENNTVSLSLRPKNHSVVSSSNATAVSVEMIDFRRGLEGEGIVQIKFNSPDAIVNLSENLQKLSIEISSAVIDESLERKLDVIDFATPVSFIDARQSGNNVKIDVEASGLYEHLVYQTGNQYTLELKEKIAEVADHSKLYDNEIEYTGNLVSFNFQNIEVRSLLQLIADASQLNVVVADNVDGNVTLRLQNVPWDQALDIVLQSKQLDQRRRGDVIWVAPASEIAQREQEALEALSKKEELEPLDNIFIQVNYAKAEELAALISGNADSAGGSGGGNSFLSNRGSVTFDGRTNTLLVNDVPERLKIIQELVSSLDRSVQQVQIESRIVVATEKFGDELGVRFGVNGAHEDRYGNIITTGGSAAAVDRYNNAALINRYTSPSGSGLPTVQPDYSELSNPIAGAPLGERLNVNLPAAASSAGSWAFSILAADYLLDLELSALQSEDRGEVISSPRVITANQTEAVIKQGVQIPYEQATSSGATSISFKDAVLALTVTPLITPDDRVDLTLKVDQDAIGEEVSTSLGGSVPSIDTRSVQTRVLVENGQTVVLGGIYEQVRRTTKSKVPFLGDIPGLGNLFRNKAVQDDKAELLIFVTPTIIKESL